MTLHCAATALACVLTLAAAFAHAAPKEVKASYNGILNGMVIGVINERFESDGATYHIVSDTKPMGLLSFVQRQPLRFSSSGQVGRHGLHPAQFEARRTPSDSPQVSAEFDWSQGQVVLKHDGKMESLTLLPGTQDRLSVMYQFMYLPLERVRQIDFPMTNGRKLDQYRYTVTESVEIDTGLGRLKTLHLVKERNPGDTVNEVWLSPQHHYFPVKVLFVERDGMRIEQIIQTIDVRD